MDFSKRKLRSGKETNEEQQAPRACTSAVDTDETVESLNRCARSHTSSVASPEENNRRACRECNFVAKTPTALKIHCKRKHGSLHPEAMDGTRAEETRTAENVAMEIPPTDQPKSTVPPTDQLSSDTHHIAHLNTDTPPKDHLSTDSPSLDQLSSDEPPEVQLSSNIPPIDQLNTAAPPIDHLSSSVPSIDQFSSEAQRFERLYCRCCSLYTRTAEEMKAHLNDESHRKLALEKNIGPLFEQCVEKVLVILSDEQKHSKDEQSKYDEGVQAAKTADDTLAESAEESASLKRKRGRPKSSQVMRCNHCGLVASNPTNLSVHIRRKHSRLYSFQCKLCNYSCVTKGDMDRHCETKKHIKRVQSVGDGQEVVVMLNAEQAAQSCEAGPAEKKHDALNATELKTTNVKEEEELEEDEEEEETEGRGSDVTCKKPKYDTHYSCGKCDFVAHSALSLDLHVRRKHTRDFEFVCLACSYYAVTRREMSRHTATEKHKLKRQRYLQKRQNALQHDKSVDENGENTTQLAENANQQSDSTDGTDDITEQSTAKLHQQTETTLQRFDEEKNTKTLHQNTDPEPLESDSVHDDAGKATAAEIGSAGEKELKINPQLKFSNDTKGSKDLLKLPDASNTEAGEEEYNNGDEDNNDVEDDDEYPCETTAGSPSSEKRVYRAAEFDKCVFSLKVPTDGVLDKDAGESFKSLHQATQVLKMSDGYEVSTRVRCDDCGFLAEGLSGLNVHITMKHSLKEKTFHCLLCGKSFHSDSSLQQHLSSSAHLRTERGSVDERPDGGAAFRCVRCNMSCNSEQELFVHIKEKHQELLREVNKYVMEDTEQINREREENPGNVCKYCSKVCKSSNSMAFLAHVRTHTGSKPFMCKICNFATAQLGDARNHVKRHLGMREYKCHLCGWAFVMKKHLNTHLLGKHGLGQPKERKYDCELCDRSFSEKWALNNHMKLHTGDKPFKCPWSSCHYAFLTHSAMKDHYRTHTGEKTFLCDLCGFAGGTRHALTKHRRQHTGERPFRCDLCSFASTTQSHLTRHKRVHTGEKPYRCPWCDYRSNCAENIRKHILHTGKHEGVKMYNCPRCDFGTNSPSEFRNHLKDQHEDIENPDLAYLHAGIVSKSFECRLRGQGSSFVEADTPFAPDEGRLGAETLQQVIIIQGYGEQAELQGTAMEEAELEESAAATLQTLAMSSVNAELLQVTQDGCIIPYTHKNYVLVESSGTGAEQALQRAEQTSHETNQDGTGPTTALDALLCAVSEIDQQDGAAQQDIQTTEQEAHVQGDGQAAVQVYGDVVQVLGHAHEEVLQFAANQLMMREGLTQVIVNDEGTHYIVTEVADGTVFTESDGTESVQEVGLVDGAGNQPSEAPDTYEAISTKAEAQQ